MEVIAAVADPRVVLRDVGNTGSGRGGKAVVGGTELIRLAGQRQADLQILGELAAAAGGSSRRGSVEDVGGRDVVCQGDGVARIPGLGGVILGRHAKGVGRGHLDQGRRRVCQPLNGAPCLDGLEGRLVPENRVVERVGAALHHEDAGGVAVRAELAVGHGVERLGLTELVDDIVAVAAGAAVGQAALVVSVVDVPASHLQGRAGAPGVAGAVGRDALVPRGERRAAADVADLVLQGGVAERAVIARRGPLHCLVGAGEGSRQRRLARRGEVVAREVVARVERVSR